ncbi:hypothetical protein CGCA056_v007404 [Colletotrichum aenigma]|uniref:uncharacterized protein n=1 Tax=Colletotrichum aenigma TaxID=1215731 RepID=UPI0018728FFE|nr:uncharacterized protein CGCA056_v007404 [Colletotrichum aenigma]KAF5521832.1 hypothetical protein CGCA056_v007404 [Colletotrichum aenigma]
MGFDPPAQDGAGRTALGYCAEYGQFEHEVCAEIILSHGKALEALKCVSWSTDDGCTPLLLAIDKGHEEMIFGYLTLLVHESPDSWMGNLPDVIEHSDSKAVKVLLDRGAKYSFERIVLAVRRGQLDVKNLFLELVHSYVAEFPKNTREWLLKLAEEDDQDTLQALPDHGASVV